VNILVTGGSGLVGRYIVDLLAASHRVGIVDIKRPHRSDLQYFDVDILDLPALTRVVGSYDAVVHLAGIPHPLDNPPDEVYRVNAIGTFNALEACAKNGVRRFVFMSSESTLGFAFSKTRIEPMYLPIDEDHVLRPQDPYGLSKITGELLCRGYSDRVGMETICLRAPWIWVPEDRERAVYRRLIEEYPRWYKNLWAFVHVDDVGSAVATALTATLDRKHDFFFVSAAENWTGRESRILAAEYFPETTELRPDFRDDCSLISTAKAKLHLKFVPKHKVSDIMN
jgi:nucleoside-diphosphate-sugar epimerase